LESKKVSVNYLHALALNDGLDDFFSIISSWMYSTVGQANRKAGSLNTFTIFRMIYYVYFFFNTY
jgi:hypothetical protein